MKAGGLEWYKLVLYEQVASINAFGEEQLTYEERGTVHAQRAKLTGRYREETDELFSDYSVEWNVRSAHGVSEGWRVRQLGGYLYTVTNVIPNIRRGFKTLICERVND